MKKTEYQCDTCHGKFTSEEGQEGLYGYEIHGEEGLSELVFEEADYHICRRCIDDFFRFVGP